MKLDLIIRNAKVVSSSGQIQTDIGILGSKIQKVASAIQDPCVREINASGKIVMPGVIDSQVHFREPGFEWKENIESGSRGALLGGVTSFFDMPNTEPPTTTPEALNDKLHRASQSSYTNYAFYVGATPFNLDHLGVMERVVGCSGVKTFLGHSTGGLVLEAEGDLRRLFQKTKRRMAFHCEDQKRLEERRRAFPENASVHHHPRWRDEDVALLATQRIVQMAQEYSRKIHILHCTTLQEINFLADHKNLVTVEVTPQHLTLSAPDCYDRFGTLAQMNPPIRSSEHLEGLWSGIRRGVVDVIGTDHAPHSLQEKEKVYPQSPSGLPGVETLLPLMLTHVSKGRLTLEKCVDLLCEGPVRVFGIQNKGFIREGYDADLLVVDLTKKSIIEAKNLSSRCGWTPFEGYEVQGSPEVVILGGQVAVESGKIVGRPLGQPLSFETTDLTINEIL